VFTSLAGDMAHNLRRAARAAQADCLAFPHTLRVPPSPSPRDPEASPARHRVAMPCQGRCRARANCWPPCLSWAGSTSAARLVASTVRSFFFDEVFLLFFLFVRLVPLVVVDLGLRAFNSTVYTDPTDKSWAAPGLYPAGHISCPSRARSLFPSDARG